MCLFHRLRISLLQTRNLKFHQSIHSQPEPSSPPTVVPHYNYNSTACTDVQTKPTLLESDHSLESSHNILEIIATHLQSCTNSLNLTQIHAQMIRSHAQEINSSAFYWNSIMRSYIRLAFPYMVLRIYVQMPRTGILPDFYTLPIALKAASQIFAIEVGRQLHSVALRLGFESNGFCESGLISVYAKAGEIGNALKVFEQNPARKLGSWNAIIGGFAQAGRSLEAINWFMELRKCGLVPDDVTMVSVASACGSLGDLNLALQIHKCIFQAKSLHRLDIVMSNSLIDMYGKCGRMDLAHKVFMGMKEANVSTWTSMIVGLAMHGQVNESLHFFRRMRESGVQPNHVTFVGVLSACVHGGLVEEARYYFDMMMRVYSILPILPHYGCIVDLLGRVGMLEEARDMVERMPMKANSVIWGALLGACEKHGNVEMGEWVAKNFIELEPWNDGVYVVLSNIYAGAGLWVKVERLRRVMNERKVAKTPAYSLETTLIGAR